MRQSDEENKAAKITLSKTQTPYTGAAQKPAVTVIYGDPGEKLTEGTDYTLTYSNNMNAGTACGSQQIARKSLMRIRACTILMRLFFAVYL